MSSFILIASPPRERRYKLNPCLIKAPGGEPLLLRNIRLIREVFGEDSDITVVVGLDNKRVLELVPDGIRTVENNCYANSNSLRDLEIGLRVVTRETVTFLAANFFFCNTFLKELDTTHSNLIVNSDGDCGLLEVGGKLARLGFGLNGGWTGTGVLVGPITRFLARFSLGQESPSTLLYEGLNAALDDGFEIGITPLGVPLREIHTPKDFRA